MRFEYKVVSAATKDGLAKEVTENLNNGWDLGALAVYHVPTGFEPVIYVQALIKDNKKERTLLG